MLPALCLGAKHFSAGPSGLTRGNQMPRSRCLPAGAGAHTFM